MVRVLHPLGVIVIAVAAMWPGVGQSGSLGGQGRYHPHVVVREPLAHCRGDTHSHVSIHWPSRRNLAFDRRLPWRRVPRTVRRWGYLIVPNARALGVDPYLVAGIMRVESDGDPLIWNLDSDARGLMQVLHASFQPATNIVAGASMLAQLQRQFDGRNLVIAAYNAGPGAVQEYGGIPPYEETRDYVIMVDYYRDLYAGLRLSHVRVARFHWAVRDLVAYYDRICGR